MEGIGDAQRCVRMSDMKQVKKWLPRERDRKESAVVVADMCLELDLEEGRRSSRVLGDLDDRLPGPGSL